VTVDSGARKETTTVPLTSMPPLLPYVITAACYLIGAVAGTLAVLGSPVSLSLGETTGGPGPVPGAWEILVNNARVLVLMAAGTFSGGLITLAVTFFNGLILGGAVAYLGTHGQGHSLLTGLAPHFLPEVAAFLVAGAADLWMATAVVAWLRGRPVPDRRVVMARWLAPQGVALGLLVVAAVIEGYVSHA
jgi:hypothetical protein